MTVCCMILYKILSCDYDDSLLETFIGLLQNRLGQHEPSCLYQYPVLELFQQVLLSNSSAYRLQLVAEAMLLKQKLSGCRQLSIAIRCQQRQLRIKKLKKPEDIQKFIEGLDQLQYPLQVEVNQKSYNIDAIDQRVLGIVLDFFDKQHVVVENMKINQLKLTVNRFVNTVMTE